MVFRWKEQLGKVFLMGGGIGVPPILELAKQLECEEKQILAGYRDQQTFLKEEFEQNGTLYISTEDGSVGTKGNVMDAIRENGLKGGSHLRMWSDSNASGNQAVCRGTEHRMLHFSGRENGMRNQSLPCLRLQVEGEGSSQQCEQQADLQRWSGISALRRWRSDEYEGKYRGSRNGKIR